MMSCICRVLALGMLVFSAGSMAQEASLNIEKIMAEAPPTAGIAQTPVSALTLAYQRALRLSDSGEPAQALDSAQEALRIDVQHLGARRLAASLLLTLNRPDPAMQMIDEGLRRHPDDAELVSLRAHALVAQGQVKQALDYLQNHTQLSGSSMGLKAGLLTQQGLYAQAGQAYQDVLKEQASNATWWLGLGIALDAQGQGSAARNAFVRAKALGTLRSDLNDWLEQRLAPSSN